MQVCRHGSGTLVFHYFGIEMRLGSALGRVFCSKASPGLLKPYRLRLVQHIMLTRGVLAVGRSSAVAEAVK